VIYIVAVVSAILKTYRRCPNCRKLQHFTSKKKGESVACKKCGYEFVLE
jgi:DNA-directed RNA polymerase subunit M/transcription elongation factor TFIIS